MYIYIYICVCVCVCVCTHLHFLEPCCGEGVSVTQGSYEPWHAGPPKMDGSWWRVLINHGPQEEGMANHTSILAVRTPWTWAVRKAKKIWHQKMSVPSHPRLEGVQYATVEEWREIANSSRKNVVAITKWKQCSVVDVSGGESKVRCCKEIILYRNLGY